MPLIIWSKLFETGIDNLDERHKVFINIINEFNDALEKGNANSVLSQILFKLINYSIDQFGFEEEGFTKYSYSDADGHIIEHQQLIKQMVNLIDKLEKDELMVSIELMEFLKEWLSNHILTSDLAYAKYLINKHHY